MKKTKFVNFRRKREGKTNYPKRLKILKGNIIRMVVRKSLKYITAQLIQYYPKGDKVLINATSKDLKKYGWNGYCRNLPSGYLLGMLIGKKAIKSGFDNAVLDIGLNNRNSSILFAVLKGAIDAGLKIPHEEKIYPKQERIEGKHISEKVSKEFQSVKDKIGKEK